MKNLYDNIVSSTIPIIMGIVNITPDSFSDGGKYYSIDNAFDHSLKLIRDGADIIDIGGESTRPGAQKISIDEEFNRVIPLIKKIIKEKPETVISIDTTKSEIAEEAIKFGARIINDISGGTFDHNMFKIAADYDTPISIMHIKGTPENMQDAPSYKNVINEIIEFFRKQITIANSKNVNKIILDPGIGFGKRIVDNYNIINSLKEFKLLNCPIMIGVSKKSFLGKSLNLDINSRENSTIIAETVATTNGANIIRTHNVKKAIELKNMMRFLNNRNDNLNV